MARVATVALCLTMLAACRGQQQQEASSKNGVIDQPPRQRLPIIDPPINRTRLLLSVARAASAHSLGLTDPGVQRSLDGKQFEVRLRFGCDGPGPGNGGLGWSIDPDGRTLRLRAVPTLSLNDETTRSVAEDDVEAIGGFWLAKPWLLQAACPTAQPSEAATESVAAPAKARASPAEATMPAAPAVQRIGIAQFFTAEDARTHRRMNQPFEAVRRLDEGERAGQAGFNLVLSGRLRARGDGRVILCAGSGRDRPPDCIVSAAVDRVWIERPEDKEVMADWSG